MKYNRKSERSRSFSQYFWHITMHNKSRRLRVYERAKRRLSKIKVHEHDVQSQWFDPIKTEYKIRCFCGLEGVLEFGDMCKRVIYKWD